MPALHAERCLMRDTKLIRAVTRNGSTGEGHPPSRSATFELAMFQPHHIDAQALDEEQFQSHLQEVFAKRYRTLCHNQGHPVKSLVWRRPAQKLELI